MIFLLSHSIDQSARRFPTKEAFRCMNDALTYQELAKKTDQLALQLIASGVKKGDRVGVYMNRCLDSAIAVYGILKAGAAYVPLNPAAPKAHSRFVISDCGIEFIVSNMAQRRGLKALLKETADIKQVIGVDIELSVPTVSWESVFGHEGTPEPSAPVLESDLAYILYTSGSTGKPKGIMHTHHSGLSFARLAVSLYAINENDRLANHSPLHFDISTLAYFAAPYVGATAVILTDAHTKMPVSQAQLISKEQITIWYSVPLALLQMIQANVLEGLEISALRWVLFAGEPFPTKHLRSLMQLWPNPGFGNLYGPTETNVCTYFNLHEAPANDEPIPIGKAWENTQCLVLDAEDKPLVPGESGELVVRSPTMMYGYWNKPELNAKCFFKRRNAAGIEETYYRTGDLVREHEGELIFLGRLDRQVKVRGYRIELDEIANVLLQHKAVDEAAVFVVEKEEEGASIHAQVLLKDGAVVSEAELGMLASEHLPKYAVPEQIAIATDFPRTATGKIDHLKIAATY